MLLRLPKDSSTRIHVQGDLLVCEKLLALDKYEKIVIKKMMYVDF